MILMNNKHAYLIMAHNQFEILMTLIKMIDYEYNDIYIHIDKKVKNPPCEQLIDIPKKSKIFIIENRIDVRWGSYSQIECELQLLKVASLRPYTYFHLLSGVDLLLKKPNIIYDYFESNYGVEYVLFDNHIMNKKYLDRINKYHLFYTKGKKNFLHKIFIALQFFVRRNKDEFSFQKGANWFNITNNLVSYILNNEKQIRKKFKLSICGDEMFIQTLVFNSHFYDRVPKDAIKGDYMAIKRYIDWNRGQPYEFKFLDYDLLIQSDAFFARKFNWEKDSRIIKELCDKVLGG